MYSAVSHHRIPISRRLTALEVRALLLRHAGCVAGHGHTRDDCAARTQLLLIRADNGWSWPIPTADGDPPAWHQAPSTPIPLCDSDIELLLEIHGEACERANCPLRSHLLRLRAAR